jgi:hypothetical protein
MTLQTTGAITFQDLQDEFGGTTPISLSEYYALAAGLPTSTSSPISLNDFYGKRFIVRETITSNTTWTPKANLARFIHIWVVGAGGSGGHGWPASNVGTYGNTDGVAGGTGGGAGGVAYSRIAASAANSSTIVVGNGGAGVKRTSENGAVNGNAGTFSSFVGSGLNMRGNGGGAGQSDYNTSGGNDSSSDVGGVGGTASGGNLLNLTGGSGGNMSVSGDGVKRSGSGGGAPRFASTHDGDGTNSGTEQASAGRKASDYSSFPTILNTYITGRDQAAIINSSVTDFDASDGRISSGPTGTPVYGAGSGGSGHPSATGSGRGGNGVVYIIYEI